MVSKYNITSHHVVNINMFKELINVLDGVDRKVFKRLFDQIEEAKGSPQEPMDWKEPNKWISELSKDGVLDKETRAVAGKLWDRKLNPIKRHNHRPILSIWCEYS